MNVSPLMEMGVESTATVTDPVSGAVWTCLRNPSGFILMSPPLDYDMHVALRRLLGFLLENGSGNLPVSARFVANQQRTVHLEWQCKPEQLQTTWEEAHLTYAGIQATCTQGGLHAESVSDYEAETSSLPEQNALFAIFNSTVMQSPELMSVYEFQPEQGLAVLESEEGNWLACVRPSAYSDHLCVLFPLAVVDDDAGLATAQCLQLLQWNSVLSLGEDVTIACLSDGQTLVLKAELNPHLAGVQDVLAMFGKLTVMVEELQQRLEEAQEHGQPASLVSASGDGLALMMSGMLA